MEFIIPAKYYTFSDFTDPAGRETGGDSGKLLVAERKPGVDGSCPEKLLIKHRFSNDPCNEFMASRIAESLGVPAPRNYLISCSAWRKNGFQSKFTCGIEYIDGLRRMTQEEIHSKEGIEFIASVHGLSALLNQTDGVSYGAALGGFYAYDFAETFMLGSGYVGALLGNSVVGRQVIWLQLQQMLENADHHIMSEIEQNWKRVLVITGDDWEDEKWAAFTKPARRFPEVINNARIRELTETIRKYYGGGEGEVSFDKVKAADVLAWYYKEYLLKCRLICEELRDFWDGKFDN